MNHPIEEEYEAGFSAIAGFDEAGRGCLCGPVFVAGVIFPKGYRHEGINDSKKLSATRREILFDQIRKDALAYQILAVSEKRIDEINIYQAVKEGMEKIAASFDCDLVLSDAMPMQTSVPVISIVKGDQKALSIAAASILAKVGRDRYMQMMDHDYPGYGLKKHKGYPTRQYLQQLKELGEHPRCRQSYRPIQQLKDQDSN